MRWRSSFYALNFRSLSEVIGSKNTKLENVLQKRMKNQRQGKILHFLIEGDFEQLKQLHGKKSLKYHRAFFDVYQVIVGLLGRELRVVRYMYCYYEETDDELQNKNYPTTFRLENLFEPRPVPGYEGVLPWNIDDIDSYEEGIYSFIDPSVCENARLIAKELDKQETSQPKIKKQKFSEELYLDLEEREKLIRYNWLLDKRNMYAIPTSQWKQNWYKEDNSNALFNLTDNHCYWNVLPEDVQKYIISQIKDVRTLCQMAQVNRKLHAMIIEQEYSDKLFWQSLREDVGIVAFTK